MYIKQIIIQGFKSYKDQTVIEPFSPKTNVIVGRNGSGKSNFFAAIRFVLSDAYTSMGREERQGLLHEGSGSAVTSAYVEIIFDNTDDRFPTGNKEVVLRRTIGAKKDEYSVDRKVVTKVDVGNLLEAAGFSRSNPYYIVPQGRVMALTNMKESDRLQLLKEVAGTQVYDTRRAESLKLLGETSGRQEKIDDVLGGIRDRLEELEEEKEELRGFQEKDREKRCLEYAYHYREKTTIERSLDDIDGLRKGGQETTDSNRTQLREGQAAIAEIDTEMNKLQRQLELQQIERRQLEEDRRDNAKTLAKKELKLKELQDGHSYMQQAQEQHQLQLHAAKTELAKKEKELAKITPEYNQKKSEEDDIRRQLDMADATRQRLVAKQGRGTRYKNKRERDAHVQKEIEELNDAIATQKANKMDVDEEVMNIEKAITTAEEEVSKLRQLLEHWNDDSTELAEQATQAQDVRDRLNDERKLLRREEEKLNSEISSTRQELHHAEKEMNQSMKRETARGLDTIRRLKQERDIPGTYGTLADLLEVNDAFRIAVEQTAGGRLFNYVVDNENTATHLLNTLQQQQGGRVTCLPISRVRPRKAKLPNAQDAVPLLSKIKYDPKFETVFQWVFGQTIVCQNLTAATQYSRSHGVNAITIDGDTANPRGAMSGGWIDPAKSMLKGVWGANKWREEYERLQRKAQDFRQKIDQKDQEITAAMSEFQKAEQKLRKAQDGFEPTQRELRRTLGDLENNRSRLDSTMKRQAQVDDNMNKFLNEREAYELELQTEFKKNLSAAEEKQLADLSNSVQDLRQQWNDMSRSRRTLESKKQILEVDIRQNLQLKLDELSGQAFEYSSSGATTSGISEAQKELKKAQKALKSVDASLAQIETHVEELTARIESLGNDKAALEQTHIELKARIEKQQKKIEKTLQQKSLLTARLAECTKNIRDLGVLPEEAFDKYERMQTNEINSRLKRVNEALKKYKHVNKKAFEQYTAFTHQQTDLANRRKDLDSSYDAIKELVEHLDRRKDEAIERTFKQVSKEFSTIFSKLVPAGHGRLVIQRRADRRDAPEESDEDGQATIESYVGVGISVSFNSKHLDEQQRIQQLSGGQKSLCAICLIFALQQTESSPMVIFDEVDANLDAQYRTAVAELLKSISNEAGTQFICTTFRPEIVRVADKCYGVTFRDKTSGIDCVPTEEALDFVGEAQNPLRGGVEKKVPGWRGEYGVVGPGIMRDCFS